MRYLTLSLFLLTSCTIIEGNKLTYTCMLGGKVDNVEEMLLEEADLLIYINCREHR